MSSLRISFRPIVLTFKQPSGTSRGIMTEKRSWLIYVHEEGDSSVVGIGECSIIEGLSPEYKNSDQYESILKGLQQNPEMDLSDFPSIKFGFESALLDLQNGGKGIYFKNQFTHGKQQIPINGLIWMGDESFMKSQIQAKIAAGFTTIKMKIGAIDTNQELELLREIRRLYANERITLRVDANGAFSFTEAKEILRQLAGLNIHSIEQPISPGNWEEMSELCRVTPVPIALDEELIGIYHKADKIDLLETIKPQYIILKPSLHGGISGTQEWIELAEQRKIMWWITSALESNVGLNAIAQLTAEYPIMLPQGLGTGGLFTNNLPTTLRIENGYLVNQLT